MTIFGLWPPVATPFNSDFSINISAFLAHCHSLLDAGATGLAVLGTTSEANSLSMNERIHLLAAMLDDGLRQALYYLELARVLYLKLSR